MKNSFVITQMLLANVYFLFFSTDNGGYNHESKLNSTRLHKFCSATLIQTDLQIQNIKANYQLSTSFLFRHLENNA